jgi:hypothetical protein
MQDEKSSLSRFAEGTDAHPTILYFADDNSQEEYIAGYHQYDCSIVKAKSKIDNPSRAVHRQIIAVVMFERFMSVYPILLQDYLTGWSHSDFTFRELDFCNSVFCGRSMSL